MAIFDSFQVSHDFKFFFGDRWHFHHFLPAQTDLKEFEYRHLRSYSHAFDDNSIKYTDLYEMRDGTKVLRLQLSVPTFDSNDRVCDSWRCLYLFIGRKWRGAHGIYAAGGYQLAFAAAARGLFKFPKELMELPLTPASCNHQPEEIFEYHEESSGMIWKCQADKNLSYITIMGLESGEMQGGSLKIPDTVDGLPVEEIHCHAFEKEIYAEEIILPVRLYKEGLRGSVFDNLRALKNIRISPENRFYVSNNGVLYSTIGGKKELVRYPAGRQDRSYHIMEGTKRIGSYGFSHCENLEEILIPDSVISIGFEAFNCCHSLTEVTLPPQIGYLDYYVFCDCARLRTVYLPDSLMNLSNVFMDCPSLTTIRLPDQLSRFGFDRAFIRCGSLKNIIVSENSKNFSCRDGVVYNKQGTMALWYPPDPAEETT